MTAKRGQGRPIGKRVIEAMEALEALGPASFRKVYERMDDGELDITNVSKYLRRAVTYGLAERIPCASPAAFKAVPEWREVIAKSPLPKPPKAKPKTTEPRPMINSVWGLGAL